MKQGRESMEELFIETLNGRVPIDQTLIQKYHLEKGMMSPFSNGRIVDKDGGFERKKPDETGSLEFDVGSEDGLVELDYGMQLSQSEMIDIAHGVDSSSPHT